MIKIIITCLLCKGRKGFSWFQLLLILQDNYFYFLKKVFLDVLSFFFFFKFFVYLSGCRVSAEVCGIPVPGQDEPQGNPVSLQTECRVLASGPSGKSLIQNALPFTHDCSCPIMSCLVFVQFSSRVSSDTCP